MRPAPLAAFLLVLAGPFGAPPLVGAPAHAQATRATTPDALSSAVVRGHCSVCHSYSLVESQRLDRANWDWVMDDMIDKYGATWIDPILRKRMVDYLVAHHGPER